MRKKLKGRRGLRSRLVTNKRVAEDEVATNQLSYLTSNLSLAGVKIRKETLNGVDYHVVPTVMLNEGVHAGSNGRLFYPGEELAKVPEIWDHKPIVVNHPAIEDKGVSACSKAVLNKQQIGIIMNTRFDAKKRLVCEAWIREDLAKKVDNRVWEAIEKRKTLEQSTGLFTDNELTEGEFEGDPYDAIARNYRPDHLAILPDVKGAFSVERGGGFCRNELMSMYPDLDPEDLEVMREVILNTIAKEAKGKQGIIARMMVENEASHEETRSQICKALEDKYPPPKGDEPGHLYPYVEAVYDDSFVFHLGGKLFTLGYKANDAGVVKLDSTPKEVVRFAEYRTKSGATVYNADPSKHKKGNTMDKAAMVAALISNYGYSKESRKTLMMLDEADIKAAYKNAVTANKGRDDDDDDEGTTNAEDDEESGETETPAKKKKAIKNCSQQEWNAMTPEQKKKYKMKNGGKAPSFNAEADGEEDTDDTESVENEEGEEEVTVEEYIRKAPPGMRDMLSAGLATHNSEKSRLIKGITANKKNQFTKDELKTMSLNQLKRIAVLATSGTSKPDDEEETVHNRYDGMAPLASLTANEEKDDQALVQPSLWDETKK